MTVIAIYRYIYSLSSRQTWLYAGSTPRDKLSSLGFAKCLEGLIHIRYHQNQTPEMSAKTRRFEPVEQSMGGTENEPGLADEHLRGIRRMPETPPSTQKRIDELVAELEGLSINQLGYPTNQCFDYSPLFRFLELSVNNVGDPFHDSNFRINTHEIEREVIAKFADLMRLAPEETWGYVTSGGTEGNMYGLYMAREMFPNGIVYFSQDTHYSVLKNLRVLNYRNIMIKSQPNGEIDYDDLRETIRINRDVPVVVFANIGTTMKGAVDNLDKVRQILEDLAIPNSYIHADAALSGMILPFVDDPQPFRFRLRDRQRIRQRPQSHRLAHTVGNRLDQERIRRPSRSVYRVRRCDGHYAFRLTQRHHADDAVVCVRALWHGRFSWPGRGYARDGPVRRRQIQRVWDPGVAKQEFHHGGISSAS